MVRRRTCAAKLVATRVSWIRPTASPRWPAEDVSLASGACLSGTRGTPRDNGAGLVDGDAVELPEPAALAHAVTCHDVRDGGVVGRRGRAECRRLKGGAEQEPSPCPSCPWGLHVDRRLEPALQRAQAALSSRPHHIRRSGGCASRRCTKRDAIEQESYRALCRGTRAGERVRVRGRRLHAALQGLRRGLPLNGLDTTRDPGAPSCCTTAQPVLTRARARQPVRVTVTTACHHCSSPRARRAAGHCGGDRSAGIVKHLDDQLSAASAAPAHCKLPKYNA